ncbi:hypothetical protein [Rubripirellula reticaptiva]|uniref:Uncharacterized protein n=1 Tax=Rubripirellula reticaptiva TaxID=2528013 RepID=A0A5C6EH50_9BACT|nr:hypothetical protein [Rubripirellula reticaptiva]TWU48322.1 hypothetical protein Poly59_51680 [Rubripirellula reticaptiva]
MPEHKPASDPLLLDKLVQAFANEDPLRDRVLQVLKAIPANVQKDFIDDPRFSIIKLNFHRGTGSKLYMALPLPDGSSSRCVALKPRLSECAEPFGLYVIAHELAHAFLRNGPWGDITDPEDAADAMAADWGFPRPLF